MKPRPVDVLAEDDRSAGIPQAENRPAQIDEELASVSMTLADAIMKAEHAVLKKRMAGTVVRIRDRLQTLDRNSVRNGIHANCTIS